MSYLSGGEIAAIGDTQTWIVDPDSDQDKRISYDQQQLVGRAIGSKTVDLALQKYGSGDGGEVMRLDAKGETVYTAAFSGSFRHMCVSDSRLLLLTAGRLYHGDGEKMNGGQDVQQDGRMVGILGDKAIVLGLTSLSEYTVE